MKRIFSVLVLGFLMFGCSAPVPMPTSTVPVAQPAATIPASTFTPVPTATQQPEIPTVTATSESGLRTQGPYFVYFQEKNGIQRLVLMDADGMGKRAIELPKALKASSADMQPPGLNIRSVSPNGHWLAFYTGSAGNYAEMPAQGTSDLTLNLLNLTTKEQHVVAPLLSSDYPNNFVEGAKKLNDPYTTAETLYQAFLNGITNSFAWSPNGRYLAFAGQMEGLSSDLYVYDVETKSIKRLSSGDQELQWIDWSPDGKWILHSSVYAVGEGMTFDVYAAAADGSSVPFLSTNALYGGIENWINSHTYLENDAQNGPGNYGLRFVDIDTGRVAKLWDGSFVGYQVDSSGKWLVIATLEDDLQLINLTTLKTTPAPEPFSDTFMRLEDGTVLPWPPLETGERKIALSPDSNTWAVATESEVQLYSSDLTPTTKFSIPTQDAFLSGLTWRPDSSGLFLIYGTEIYALDLSRGEVSLVETNLVDNQGLTYKWVHDQ